MKSGQICDQCLLDAMDANVAIVDKQGIILKVNQAWTSFAQENEGWPNRAASVNESYIGDNYLEICSNANAESSDGALTAYRGIRSVIEGKQKKFVLEYPCHSPCKLRWFRMHVTSIPKSRPKKIMVMHYDITHEKQATNLQYSRLHDLRKAINELGLLADHYDTANSREKSAPAATIESNRNIEASEAERLVQKLSPRERSVLKGIIRGARAVDIANELSIHAKSVSTYRSRIFEKLGVENNAELFTLMGRFGHLNF